jgi:hypothetical protein
MSELPSDKLCIADAGANPGRRKAAAQEARGAQTFAVTSAPTATPIHVSTSENLRSSGRAGGVGVPAVTETAVPHELALFVTDDELHQRIAPHLGRDRFRAALKECESGDPLFPRIHSLWRGRYWPAVRAWLDRNQGVSSNDFAGSVQDGPENFDAPTR